MTAPVTIARAIATNLMTDVQIAQGAVANLGHAYDGRRKLYDYQHGPFAVVLLADRGIKEVRYTMGSGGRRRITYDARILLAWVQSEKLDTSTDNVAEDENFLTLIENVKASLRKHVSLGGLVLKAAENEIDVRSTYIKQNVPHHEAEIDFAVLDEIVSTPQG